MSPAAEESDDCQFIYATRLKSAPVKDGIARLVWQSRILDVPHEARTVSREAAVAVIDAGNERIIFGDATGEQRRLRRWQAASPLLIGLLIPLVVAYVLDFSALRHIRFLITLLLFSLMIVAAALYAASVLTAGEVRGLVVDTKRRLVEFVVDGMFASSRMVVPFDEIASVRRTRVGGREGLSEARVLVELRGRELIELPESTSDADIAAIMSSLGRTPKVFA